MTNPTTTKRIALITGANKGLGFEIARQLGQQHHTVLVGARDAERGERAAQHLRGEGLDAHFVPLAVTSDASVTAAATLIEERFGRLDVLVNNAGISLDDAPPSQLSFERLIETYDTNVFGVVRVTQALLPLLRRSDRARIVNMGSAMGSLTYTSDPENMRSGILLLAYASSKAALHSVTVQFANELRAEGIKVNVADPGYAPTDLSGGQGFNTIEEGAGPAVRLATLDENGPTATILALEGVIPW
ncbi:SDR family oxidoreductase [Deinococcus oregonensis]|uniref:SDR family oxidoreductase n=1 Tax=Deinococcus oregonensis TaxID=1805970 RepID=A0ABV6AWK9_9DEIO